MFTNQEKCLEMLEGSYRKLKSYYYYNKNYILIREKIAVFEADEKAMDNCFDKLWRLLSESNTEETKPYFNALLDQMDFCVLPKKFENESIKAEHVTSNAIPKNKKLRTINFFIDLPIELLILDTLWTLLLGQAAFENNALSKDVYGNTLANHILYKNGFDDIVDSINFASPRMFNIYFNKYCDWRNNAFAIIDSNHTKKKNSVLISLDIQSYYYNVKFDFNLRKILGLHPLIDSMRSLTLLMQQIYHRYYNAIKPYRKGFSMSNEMAYPLPIGLFSSMLISNLYLSEFDSKVNSISSCSYYGRYVDDLLFCFDVNEKPETSLTNMIQTNLVDNGILNGNDSSYTLSGFPNLSIQKEKIKVLYISADESRALIDIYNEKIRVIPSQMSVLPDYNLQIEDFNEAAYAIENFGKDYKIRDIGNVNIDAFKVSRYFAALAHKQSNTYTSDESSEKDIAIQIEKINNFFVGSQSLEYYSNWMNYACFLVLTRKYTELKQFYTNMKNAIESIPKNPLSTGIFKKGITLCNKARESLHRHLSICIATALALDVSATETEPLNAFNTLALKLMNANMFNHALVSLPIANFLDYDKNVSYSHLEVIDYGRIVKGFEKSFKVKWSPRFIHLEELLLALFLHNHNHQKSMNVELFSSEELVNIYFNINHIKSHDKYHIGIEETEVDSYTLQSVEIPNCSHKPDIATIAVGSIKMEAADCIAVLKDGRAGLSRNKKRTLRDLLIKTYEDSNKEADLLVLPELYVPIYWLKEMVDFSRKSQVAIVTGLQYMTDNSGQVKNYIATILPFRSGRKDYRNAFVFIREKNDYSPIEKEGLAKAGNYCLDAKTPYYQVFKWNGMDLATFVCFEFTDIFARALLKGKCDLIAAPVFNSDTTYFSNIIDSTARDLHTVIVQANNSVYGDSRITGPYDRDNKDIVKIKGGENNNVIIGKVNLYDIIKYQAEYYDNQEMLLAQLRKQDEVKKPARHTPDIKRLSARFDNSRAKRKLSGS